MERSVRARVAHDLRRTFAPIVAIVVVVSVLAVPAAAPAQDYDLVTIHGRVLWVAGQMMVVSPYASGAGPVSVDLSQASLDEYMSLKTGDVVTVTGMIPIEGDRILATSIR